MLKRRILKKHLRKSLLRIILIRTQMTQKEPSKDSRTSLQHMRSSLIQTKEENMTNVERNVLMSKAVVTIHSILLVASSVVEVETKRELGQI